MTAKTASLAMVFYLACCAAWAGAQTSGQQCPVAIKNVELSYNHDGGQSKPVLGMLFANHAGKRIGAITFSLSLLDPNGSPHSYPDDLVYRSGLDPAMQKRFMWDLRPDQVDIHRTGETVVVKEVSFSDSSHWKDDGSESCVYTIDYHPQ